MISKLALLSNLLLASVALTVPSSRLVNRLARRREGHQSQHLRGVEVPSIDISDSDYSFNWAGAILEGGTGTFTTVTGIFTVPAPSGDNGAAGFWVGIDGDTCPSVTLQVGVDLTIRNGVVSYDGWYVWYPDYSGDFSGFSISAGDVIAATVAASSTTSGTVVLENLTTGQTAVESLTSSTPLCERSAEWIAEGGGFFPFVDFGTVTFSGAIASGDFGTYTPSGAKTINIDRNGQLLTSVSISEDTVTVQYV